jgi:hypothetical protein
VKDGGEKKSAVCSTLGCAAHRLTMSERNPVQCPPLAGAYPAMIHLQTKTGDGKFAVCSPEWTWFISARKLVLLVR